MSAELLKAMGEVADLNEKAGKGTTKVQGGKTYTNAVTRVEVFRKHLGLVYGIDTEVLFPVKGVMMIAKVKDRDGAIIGSGHSYADNLQKEKSLEKLETVAVGRAMASLGLGGGEYATDAEIESWGERYDGIGVELSADDVDCPIAWINERMGNLQAFVVDSKQPTQKNFNARVSKVESDPIFAELDANNISVWERTRDGLQEKLTERLSNE